MWLKLEHLHEHVKGREMFVVKAFGVPCNVVDATYDTDPYCVWLRTSGNNEVASDLFGHWPHPFMPTHFCLLPEGRE